MRAQAFRELQFDGLCDCKEFHFRIGVTDWHSENAKLQKTWGRLMMFLASFSGADSDKGSLLEYQRKCWGMRESDTCVIELSGLSAAGLHIKLDRNKYRTGRINTIRRKLTESAPHVVVMYGFSGEKYFKEIAGNLARGEVVEHQNNWFVFADHPAAQRSGNTDNAWRNLGVFARGEIDR